MEANGSKNSATQQLAFTSNITVSTVLQTQVHTCVCSTVDTQLFQQLIQDLHFCG